MSLSVFVVNVVARENGLLEILEVYRKTFILGLPLSFFCHENFMLTEFETYNSVLLLWNFTFILKRFQNNLCLYLM